jgi:hypothetical protein
MKAVRYIIFIPIIYVIIGIVYTLLPWPLIGLMSMSEFWLIFLLVIFGSIAVVAFHLLPGGIAWLSAKISPSKNFAFYSILVISILMGITAINHFWNMPEINENGLGIFFSIILTCLTIGFTASFSVGAGIEMFEEKKMVMSIFFIIGTIIFYIGIFLAFCLLTTKICYINPDRSYAWYSGIWHGLFILPHWIVSWFSDEIYCKAPNATVAYSIWWWVTLIFSILIMIGGGSRNSNRDY